MKRIRLSSLGLVLLSVACGVPEEGAAPASDPTPSSGNTSQHDTRITALSATIVGPVEGAQIEAGSSIQLRASTTSGAIVTDVEFYSGTQLIAEATSGFGGSSPTVYGYWSPYTPGTYALTAKVYDSAGGVATSAPVNITITPDVTPPVVSVTAPTSGSWVASKVAFDRSASDNGIIDRVDFYVGDTLAASSNAYSLWDSSQLPNGTYPVTARAYDTAGNVGVSAPITITVNNAPSVASYDAAFHAPRCAGPRSACDTFTLLPGRGYSVGPEFNTPNTVDGCSDAYVGYSRSAVSSIERIAISTVDGSTLATGKLVQVDVTLWASNQPSYNRLEIYTAADARAPVWQLLKTYTPTYSGSQLVWERFVLPTGINQVVRARVRDFASASGPCDSPSYASSDHDDLVFTVGDGVPDTVPPTVELTAPVAGSTVSGTVSLEATATDDLRVSQVEFYVDGTLLATDTSAPYSASWVSGAVTPGNHTLAVRAIDGAGNTADASSVVSVADSAPATTITFPAAGSTIRGLAGFIATATDGGGVARVEFYADGTLIGTDTTAAYSLIWDTSVLTDGPHTLMTRAYDTAGNVGESAPVSVVVSNAGHAMYNATLKAPKCWLEADRCESDALLWGRAGLGPETNAPNTLNNSCADGTAGTYRVDESVDSLSVRTLDGGPLEEGRTVRIEARIFARSAYSSDVLELYHAPNANAPSWTQVATLAPTTSGAQFLSTTITLPAGTLQAVRARLRYGGSAGACGTGSWDDHDDLAFPVKQLPPDVTAPTVSVSSPAQGTTLDGGAVTVSASATDDRAVTRVEFFVDGTLIGTDTTSPFSVSWGSGSVANGSHSVTAKAYDAAGNTATSAPVSITVSDTTAPFVSIVSPTSGTVVTGTTTISVSTSDNSGVVARVEYYVNYALQGTVTTAPFSLAWNTTNLAAGSYRIQAMAYDGSGNAGQSYAVNVTVYTAPPGSGTLTYNATNTNSAQQNTVNQTITLSAGQTLTLGTCGVTGSSFSGDTYLRLYNPSGTQVAFNDDACGGTGSNFTYTVPAGTGGSYQLRAGCYSSNSCSGTVAWTIQ